MQRERKQSKKGEEKGGRIAKNRSPYGEKCVRTLVVRPQKFALNIDLVIPGVDVVVARGSGNESEMRESSSLHILQIGRRKREREAK